MLNVASAVYRKRELNLRGRAAEMGEWEWLDLSRARRQGEAQALDDGLAGAEQLAGNVLVLTHGQPPKPAQGRQVNRRGAGRARGVMGAFSTLRCAKWRRQNWGSSSRAPR
jgi:hypothetical protein